MYDFRATLVCKLCMNINELPNHTLLYVDIKEYIRGSYANPCLLIMVKYILQAKMLSHPKECILSNVPVWMSIERVWSVYGHVCYICIDGIAFVKCALFLSFSRSIYVMKSCQFVWHVYPVSSMSRFTTTRNWGKWTTTKNNNAEQILTHVNMQRNICPSELSDHWVK